MRILFVGDVVGRPGRRALAALLPFYRDHYDADVVVANGENAAGGLGITGDTAHQMFAAGVDVLTMGNHVWDKRDAISLLEDERYIIRPLNMPPGTPGRGSTIFSAVRHRDLAVINVLGRVFNDVNLDCPFRALDREVAVVSRHTDRILVDIHAEATSEKHALARYVDGRVSAVIGTHTHVQTADACILPGGTAFITDVGMTGPQDSVIGVRTDLVIKRFLTQMPVSNQVAGGPVVLSMVLVEIGDHGKAVSVIPHRSQHEL